MRNIILLVLFLFAGLSLTAQDYSEVVYLKNGNMIRGKIVQLIPNKSLKIKSGDGKIYVYQMSEVTRIAKISKTEPAASVPPVAPPVEVVPPIVICTEPVTKIREVEFTPVYNKYAIRSGYRGIFDLGYTFGISDDIDDTSSLDRLEMSTSHGYQFNPYFYVGVGGGVSYFHNSLEELICFPVFINPRVNFSTGSSVSPFIDLRGGYSFGEYIKGLYLSPSIGARFLLDNSNAINFGVGYVYQEIDGFDSSVNFGGLSLKIGFDF